MTWHSRAFGHQGGTTVAAIRNALPLGSLLSSSVFGEFSACSRKFSAPPGSKLPYLSCARVSIHGRSSATTLGDVSCSESSIDGIDLVLQAAGLTLQGADLALECRDLGLQRSDVGLERRDLTLQRRDIAGVGVDLRLQRIVSCLQRGHLVVEGIGDPEEPAAGLQQGGVGRQQTPEIDSAAHGMGLPPDTHRFRRRSTRLGHADMVHVARADPVHAHIRGVACGDTADAPCGRADTSRRTSP